MDGLGVPARVEHVLLLPCAPMFERELPSRQLEARKRKSHIPQLLHTPKQTLNYCCDQTSMAATTDSRLHLCI
jgi:hypothetical protein